MGNGTLNYWQVWYVCYVKPYESYTGAENKSKVCRQGRVA